jgi:thiamine kinase-like enzyme
LANNVLIRGDGRLCLIDFEYASYNLRGYDLANYLV